MVQIRNSCQAKPQTLISTILDQFKSWAFCEHIGLAIIKTCMQWHVNKTINKFEI